MKNVFIHSLADVLSEDIGIDTKIWQFCVVLPGAKIGKNCNICSHCFVENEVIIGDNCTVKNGVQLWDGLTIENNVFIGPNVTFTNDAYPRSERDKSSNFSYTKTIIKNNASIGGGAVILPGVTIGSGAMIGAGAVVAEDVQDNMTVIGNKARAMRKISNLK